ncbi:hypothetical protein PCS_01831 [Desulfocurvibacter africanus PCS]|uniref:Uncharacterized protein n=1 Tax=Desulfocurvibacter africanus PCS TaxID=1262666 RepID=M5PTF0_DESAF|nr:hypothetical protein [Desulfocurvibacter africanus]EMG37320.1 hypothetical protein PCS_01831 [Desulfocurvibacter africanus PCS]
MVDKRVIVLTANKAALDSGLPATGKFLRKAATVRAYHGGDITADVLKIEGAVKIDAAGLAAFCEGESPVALVELGAATAAGLDEALGKVLELADRRTLVVFAASDGVHFFGQGINPKAGKVEREAFARDIVPTIAYVADTTVPADCTGAVLYQVLKDPDLKMKEIAKLKEALGRMETALQRDNREPWDKHDCA